MAIYLFTVQKIWDDGNAPRIGEGVRMSELSIIAKGKNFIQGIVLELRFPDGSKKETFLLNYAVSAMRQDDELFHVEEDPFVRFTLPVGLRSDDVPVGTEVWWLDEKIGKSLEEMDKLLAAA